MISDSQIGKAGGREWKAALDKAAAEFGVAIDERRLDRENPDSPLLKEPDVKSLMVSIKDLMVQGFKEIMDGLRYAEDKKARLNDHPLIPKRGSSQYRGLLDDNPNPEPHAKAIDGEYYRHNVTRNVPAIRFKEVLDGCPLIDAWCERFGDDAPQVKKRVVMQIFGSIIHGAVSAAKDAGINPELCIISRAYY